METRTLIASTALMIAVVLALFGGLPLATADSGEDAPSENDPNRSNSHPAIEDGLLQESDDGSASQQSDDEGVTVVVEAESNRGAAARDAVAEHGAVELRYESLIQGVVPRENLEDLANEESVRYVRSPLEGTTDGNTSEGVETINADIAQERGWRGENATVVVIDSGFDPTHDPIADNVIHTNDTTGDGIGGESGDDTAHGDGAAEIVADVAPDVNLVLVRIETEVELLNAINYVDDNEWGENGSHLEIDAVSMSYTFAGGLPNDGTALLDQEIDESVTKGTAWFVSAGNDGDGSHWNGTFRDTDGDQYHEFGDGGDECNDVDGPLSVRLQWNDWPTSNQDYDLVLYNKTDEGLDPVASSANVQNGDQPPTERVTWDESGSYCVAIYNYDADGGGNFDMFIVPDSRTLEYATVERSVAIPATGKRVTAVGAVTYYDASLRPYSSQGPTIDGRTKPDIVGPDGVSSAAYAPDRFYGTSAATPHAAGVAALVRSANDSASADETNDRLTTTADPLGTPTPDNATGAGLVNAAAAVPPQDPTGAEVPDAINESNDSKVPVDITFDSPPKPGTVSVVVTDESGTSVSNSTSIDTSKPSTTVHINATQLEAGTLTVNATTVDAFGWRNPNGVVQLNTTTKVPAGPPARVKISDITVPKSRQNVSTVTVDNVTLPEGGFVGVYDSAFFDGAIFDSHRGSSAYLSEGNHSDIVVELDDPFAQNDTYVAMVHKDTNDNENFDYVASEGAEDSPYTDDSNSIVTSEANMTFENSIEAYANESGIVTSNGLRESVDDWRTGDIGTGLLRDIVDAWRIGEPV